ncbi:MAG: endo-1,4-beta-xylanase [Lachnospiraceae bacterium]|nr:endo-1,4-beta-xylanase [Lachnospiraceae bacterium]
MKHKRVISVLLIVMMILTGCGSSKVKLPAQTEVTDQTLKDVFAEHGMKVGTCVSSRVTDTQKYADLVIGQFNSLTMENAMKPDYILNQKESQAAGKPVVELNSEALSILSWAKTNGFSMRGHTLIWHSQTPDWLFRENFASSGPYVGREEMLRRMEALISGIFEELDDHGYLDLFYAYDVVNEAWMEDGSMRTSNWKRIIGDDYLWYAFYYADRYAPESIDLYYNDYNEQYKAECIADFVETLKDDDGRYLIDGIGLQAHLFTEDDLANYLDGVDVLAETGLKLELTEVDLGLGKYEGAKSATDANLRVQGQYFYELFEGLFKRVDEGKLRMDAVTFWGFSDGLSWRREYSPQLYDSDLDPKYALYGVMQIKEHAGYESAETAK